jgi:hypothetical protein
MFKCGIDDEGMNILTFDRTSLTGMRLTQVISDPVQRIYIPLPGIGIRDARVRAVQRSYAV